MKPKIPFIIKSKCPFYGDDAGHFIYKISYKIRDPMEFIIITQYDKGLGSPVRFMIDDITYSQINDLLLHNGYDKNFKKHIVINNNSNRYLHIYYSERHYYHGFLYRMLNVSLINSCINNYYKKCFLRSWY